MAPSVVSALTKNIRNGWKKHRHHPSKAPDKTIIETSFLRRFIKTDCIRMDDGDIGQINVSAYGKEGSYECHCITITGEDTTDGPTGETLRFHYFGGSGPYRGTNYGLIILDRDENVLYWREAGQNPRTEWIINCLASDLEDGNGNFIFDGDPVTI